MSKTLKISISQFNQIQGIAPVVDSNDKNAKKELKYDLLESVQGGLSDKWYNVKEGTKEALKYACMLSVEQGFFYCSPTHLSDKFKISVTTVYAVFKELIEAGVLYKVNRSATKHNGKGNAVYFFTSHPNFEAVCAFLGVDWKANCNADCKAEIAETPTLPTDSSDSQASTLPLTSNLQKELKENVKHYNVEQDDSIKMLRDKIEKAKKELAEKPYEKPAVKWHKYVPKEINEKFGYYGSILTDLWRKIKLAERKVNVVRLRDIDKMEVAMQVLNNLKKHPRRKEMSLDEMCAYVYKGQLNGLFNLMANYNLEGMFIDEYYEYYAYLDVNGEHILTNSENEPEPIVEDNRSTFEWWQEEIIGGYDVNDMPF